MPSIKAGVWLVESMLDSPTKAQPTDDAPLLTEAIADHVLLRATGPSDLMLLLGRGAQRTNRPCGQRRVISENN